MEVGLGGLTDSSQGWRNKLEAIREGGGAQVTSSATTRQLALYRRSKIETERGGGTDRGTDGASARPTAH